MTNRRSKQATLKAQAVEALGQRMLALESRGSLPRLICEARLVLQEALAPKALVQDLQDKGVSVSTTQFRATARAIL